MFGEAWDLLGHKVTSFLTGMKEERREIEESREERDEKKEERHISKFSFPPPAVDGSMDTETLTTIAKNDGEQRMHEAYHAANERAHKVMIDALTALPAHINRNGGQFHHDPAEFEVHFPLSSFY